MSATASAVSRKHRREPRRASQLYEARDDCYRALALRGVLDVLEAVIAMASAASAAELADGATVLTAAAAHPADDAAAGANHGAGLIPPHFGARDGSPASPAAAAVTLHAAIVRYFGRSCLRHMATAATGADKPHQPAVLTSCAACLLYTSDAADE